MRISLGTWHDPHVKGAEISDLVMGVDGTSLCAASGDGTLAVYDVRKSGEKVRHSNLGQIGSNRSSLASGAHRHVGFPR